VESVKNSPSEFPTLSTGLGNPAQNPSAGFPTFPPRRRRVYINKEGRNETETTFQLTDGGQFKHDKNASVASLRS
jgi:hypothetical protein